MFQGFQWPSGFCRAGRLSGQAGASGARLSARLRRIGALLQDASGRSGEKIIALSKLPDPKWASAVYDNSLCSTPDDGEPTLKGMEVVLDAAAKENPKAKAITVQQLVDLR
jgi:hypothetical protein